MRQKTQIDIPFPRLGLIESTALREQPELSTLDVQNMRAFSPFSGRSRGSQRSGIGKWCTAQIAGSSGRIQCLNHVVTIQASTESQLAMQVRAVTPIAVIDGKVRTFDATQSLTPTGVSDPDLLATAPFIQSVVYGQKVYFCDGTKYVKYDPATGANGTVSAWSAATAGTIPANGADVCRLIATWNNRVVMSGIKSDPQVIFMSAMGDAENWDYAPSPQVVTQAVAFGTTEDTATLPEPVMSLMPYSSDVMFVGLDHSIYAISGDVMMGGQVDLISDITGTAFGDCWCRSPEGHLYFFGSRGGVFRMVPGSQPERITATRFERRMAGIDLNTHYVRLVWDDEEIGVRVFVTSLAGRITDNYFYDVRNDAWFRDVYGNQNHNPVAVHVYDGDDPDDRTLWLGGQDGYVRYASTRFTSDDGTAIDSHVVLGPLQSEGGNIPFVVTELQGILDSTSSNVTWELGVGNSAEDVSFNSGGYLLLPDGGRIILEDGSGYLLLENTSATNLTGTLSPTRSYVANPRRRGMAAYIKLSNETLDEAWEMEYVRVSLSVVTSSKRRRL